MAGQSSENYRHPLLTANVQMAEEVVLEAIDRFDPDRDTTEALLRDAIRAAIQRPSSQSQSSTFFEPLELQAVSLRKFGLSLRRTQIAMESGS